MEERIREERVTMGDERSKQSECDCREDRVLDRNDNDDRNDRKPASSAPILIAGEQTLDEGGHGTLDL